MESANALPDGWVGSAPSPVPPVCTDKAVVFVAIVPTAQNVTTWTVLAPVLPAGPETDAPRYVPPEDGARTAKISALA